MMTQEIIRKIEVGDALSDEDLETAFAFYDDLTKKLWLLGSKFHLAWLETQRVTESLRGFLEHRKRGWAFLREGMYEQEKAANQRTSSGRNDFGCVDPLRGNP